MKLSIDSILESKPPKNGKYYTIAIDGRGGAGKSTLVEYLRHELPHFIVLNGDDYFEPVEGKIVWGEFNEERFQNQVIDPIARGETTIHYEPYNWNEIPNLSDKRIHIDNAVIIERVYSFDFKIDWDLKIWVETPKDICRQRGFSRETMPKDRVEDAWRNVWQPLEDEYIAKVNPIKLADVVVDGTKPYDQQIK